MYEKFFTLSSKPFDLAPNPFFLYMSHTHTKAVTHLEYSVQERAGFILFTGEVGSGKTTLIKSLIKKLGKQTVFAYVFNTQVSSEQLIAMINEDFGLPVQGRDKVQLVKELYRFLIDQYSSGYQALLIIDEAQNLKPEILEEVRLLSNLATDSAKLLNIILVGQPELRDMISHPALRQLKQRITVRYHLSPLDRNETEAYILHRMEKAGNRSAASFSVNALNLIHKYSGGIPRLINILCDYLLLTAFVEESRTVDSAMVTDIAEELELAEDEQSVAEIHPDEPSAVKRRHKGLCLEDIAVELKTMNERLDQLQKEAAVAGPLAISGIGKRLDILEGALREHMGSSGLWMKEIRDALNGNDRLPSSGPALQAVPAAAADKARLSHAASQGLSIPGRSNKGFLRRIFG